VRLQRHRMAPPQLSTRVRTIGLAFVLRSITDSKGGNMDWLGEIFWPLLYAAISIGCLYWANRVMRATRLRERLGLDNSSRLFTMLVLGGMAYGTVYRIVMGILSVFRSYSGWTKAGEFLGGAACVAFLAWVITRPDWRS
jgi:hypothetical protein